MSRAYSESMNMHEHNLRVCQLADYMRKHGFKCANHPDGLAVEVMRFTRHGAVVMDMEVIASFKEANALLAAHAANT